MTNLAHAITDRLAGGALVDGYSLEMTAKDVTELEKAAPLIPPGTRLSIAFLPGEDAASRVAAATTVSRLGFVPVPHISARRLASESELRSFVEALVDKAKIQDVFVIAGDPSEPLGPYEDALALIRTGLLKEHGIRHVGISGYPEGHPAIAKSVLRDAMLAKLRAIEDQGMRSSIMTQFGFDADRVPSWLAEVRADGVTARVHIGVPGPASIKTLIRFAARCGVGTSAGVMKKYGVSITKLIGTAGPELFVDALAGRLLASAYGDVRLHLYPFGGLSRTAAWAAEYASRGG